MTFTKLRLSGFKSFVDPTELHIEPGLTGIVGPNGCGKSNMVEALRWVMGETSAKRIRGGEMDDVIFAGSATRPARNVAEVQLLLDNGDRSAPAALNHHDEIEVVRRLERASGSNYRVNGRDIRARDVQLLFADSATGAHSPALVSQGRVGAVVNAKPVERRALLEEAAGISGLHSRRHEAELRLRAAEANLTRLDDVLGTLETQLKGLKKQARQASRYKNLAGHIRRHEAVLLHLDGERARTELQQAESALKAGNDAVTSLTQSAATAATGQAEAAAVLPALRQAEAEAAAGLQRLRIEQETLDQEEARITKAQAKARQHLSEILDDRARAGEQAQDARDALDRLEVEERRLNTAAAEEADAVRLAEESRDAAARAAEACEQALAELAERIAADDARAAALERRREELSARLERLKAQAGKAAEDRANLAAEREGAAGQGDAARTLAEAEAALTAARDGAEAAAQALAAARQAETRAREALQESAAERDRLAAEIAALSDLVQAGQDDAWPPVLDALTVAPGLELALGAALGDDLSAPAESAAPIHWQALAPYDRPPALPEGVEPLSRFVQGSAALGRRLSQIGVVAEPEAGPRLQPLLQPGQRLVCRQGSLWRWDGYTVQAGAPTAAAKRLAQRNRLSELEAALPAREERAAALASDGAAARETLEQAAAADDAARSALNAAFNRAAKARDGQTDLARRAAAAESRLEALAEAAARLEAELREGEAELSRTASEREALPDLTAARAELEQRRQELAERRAALGECQAAVDRLAREAAARDQRLQAIAEERGFWRRRVEQAERHLHALDDRQTAVQQEIDELAERPAEISRRREAVAEQVEAAERRRQTAADALAEGETRLAKADRALKEEEQKLSAAREERVRSEGQLAQFEHSLRTLEERARERLDRGLDRLLELAEIDPAQPLPPRADVERKLERLLRERDNMGPVNLRADQEARELAEKIDELEREKADLISAIERLRRGIASLNREGRERLLRAFDEVNKHFAELFTRLFGGGKAHLKLIESDDPLEAGLEIMASPPGKRLQVLSLLSGGEQALTALSLLFAVFLTNPAPICVLDEVDAPLDDANVDRFCSLVEELARTTATRFLIITHHRMTMARVNRLYGVTMAERGVSQLVSVDLETAEELRESA